MKFERTEAYNQKLFEQALFDDKNIVKDAKIIIIPEHGYSGKLKAYCEDTETFLQFPRHLRTHNGQRYIADVVEVVREDDVRKYYRVMNKSIRKPDSDEVVE